MDISPQDIKTSLEVVLLSKADHFAHPETDGIVVDLFWHRRGLENEFRIEVEDRREGARFVLHPTTGREAIEAFHHPFSVANGASSGERRAA
jgi:hypothetical protein